MIMYISTSVPARDGGRENLDGEGWFFLFSIIFLVEVLWFSIIHGSKCTKLPKSLYDELVKCNDNDIAWSCKVCKVSKSDLKSISATLTELKESSDSRLAKVEDRLSSLETKVKETVRQEVKNVTGNVSDSLRDNLAATVEDIVHNKMKELVDSKNRSQNIVIFKMKCSDSPQATKREQHNVD